MWPSSCWTQLCRLDKQNNQQNKQTTWLENNLQIITENFQLNK